MSVEGEAGGGRGIRRGLMLDVVKPDVLVACRCYVPLVGRDSQSVHLLRGSLLGMEIRFKQSLTESLCWMVRLQMPDQASHRRMVLKVRVRMLQEVSCECGHGHNPATPLLQFRVLRGTAAD
jgi:hypothetical protein